MKDLRPSPGTKTALPPSHLGWSCERDLRAVPSEVSRELVGLNQTLLQLGLPIERLFSLELVLAEILNNVVEHAYENSGRGRIRLRIEVYDNCIHCSISDQGLPMPGSRLPAARRHMPDQLEIPDLPEGGFGWGLIHDMTEGLIYDRTGKTNLLSFRIGLAH